MNDASPPVPPIGSSAFSTAHVSGRVHTATFIVRSQIASAIVSEEIAPQDGTVSYRIEVMFSGGAKIVLTMPTYEQARKSMGALGMGDLALTGMVARPESDGD